MEKLRNGSSNYRQYQKQENKQARFKEIQRVCRVADNDVETCIVIAIPNDQTVPYTLHLNTLYAGTHVFPTNKYETRRTEG